MSYQILASYDFIPLIKGLFYFITISGLIYVTSVVILEHKGS